MVIWKSTTGELLVIKLEVEMKESVAEQNNRDMD